MAKQTPEELEAEILAFIERTKPTKPIPQYRLERGRRICTRALEQAIAEGRYPAPADLPAAEVTR
jgi:hypothetical protein